MGLGNRIREARYSLHLTQRELADRLGVDQMTVSRWERNERDPLGRNVYALAELSGKPVAWFYEEVVA